MFLEIPVQASHVFTHLRFKVCSHKKHSKIVGDHSSIHDVQRWARSALKDNLCSCYFTVLIEIESRSKLQIVQKLSCKPWIFYKIFTFLNNQPVQIIMKHTKYLILYC